MKKFFQSYSSRSDKYTLSTSQLFRVQFLNEFKIITGDSSNINAPDEIDLVIKSIDLPNIVVGAGEDLEINTDYVTYSAPANSILKPENNNFSITVYNTLENPIETIFIPWMEHSTSAFSSTYPFNRSTLDVIIYKNNILNNFGEEDMKYIYSLEGVYPVHIDTPTLDHETQTITRTIGFKFNIIRLKYISRGTTNE